MKLRYDWPRQAALPLRALLATAALAASMPSLGAEPPQVFTGRLSVVSARHIEVDRTHRFPFQPGSAECFDTHGNRMTCQTLVGIGYADRARITLTGGQVRRIDLLDLQQ